MTTYNLNPVAELVQYDQRDLDLLANSCSIFYTRLAQAINTLMAASGGSPGTGSVTSITAGQGITMTPASPITTTGTIAVSVTAGQIAFGDASSLITSSASFLWDDTNKILTEAGLGLAPIERLMTETTDSTSMTEIKQQPFHLWQITNKVRTPGNDGATRIPNLSAGTSSWECIPTGGLTGFNKLTVSGWFYPMQYAGGGSQSNVCHCGDTGSAFWSMGYANSGGSFYQAQCSDSSGHLTQVVTGSVPTSFLNQWHHFMLVWDGTVARVTYYVDGILIGNGNTVTAGTMNFSGVSGKLDISQNSSANGADGIAEEFQIYAGYLGTASDATFLYNSGAGTNSAISGQTPTAWYHFDDALGSTTSVDSSGNGHTLSRVGTGTLPTFTTGLLVPSPTLATQNVISSQDGAANLETQIVKIGSVAGTVNVLGTLKINGVAGVGNHPLLDGAVDNDTLAGTVVRGDVIVGNSTPKWARLAKGTSGQVLRSDGTDVAYGAVDGTTITGAFTDVTNGNVSSTRHGFAPKSPADATQFLNGAATPAFAAVKDSDLSTTDITTNNVSSTKHGFAPKSPADATQFLNGAATPAFAAVKDSDLSTTDITTNDVSTSKHGFAPKGDGNVNHFLNGAGAYSGAAGTGNVTTSATLTAHAIILGNGTTDVTVLGSLGTSGQLLSSQGAGLDPTWITASGTGTVTSITAGTGLTGGTITTSGTIALDTPVAVANGGTGATTLTAHGVVIGNTTTAVNVTSAGTANQVLMSNGASADPTFQLGGLTWLADISPATTAAADFTSIPSGYRHIVVMYNARDTKASTVQSIYVKYNNDGTAANYSSTQIVDINSTTVAGSTQAATTNGILCAIMPGANALANAMGSGTLTFYDYTNTTRFKRMITNAADERGTNSQHILYGSGYWKGTPAAITRLTFTTDGTAYATDTIFSMYGAR